MIECGGEVSEMIKCKKLFIGCGLAVITCVMWLVSACSQSADAPVPVAPTVVKSPPTASSTTTTEPPTLSKSTMIVSPTTTTPSSTVTNSPSTPTPTTTTEPPAVDNSTQTTTTTPFYDVDINSYTLTLNGAVSTSLSLSYAQILAYPAVTQTARIICPGEEDETDQWTGVPLSTLLNAAGLSPEASEVVFTGLDGYYVQLPLASVLDSGVFLAYKMNGQTLTWERGYPLRLVVTKNLVGSNWPRWVTSIEVKSNLVSFSNSSAIIQNSRSNIPTSGSKLCSCFLSATIGNYQVVQDQASKKDKSDSLVNQQKS
jgi:DMSO/TMAO reductase YedYZ molybdopterin-dependent catalytic subunit